MSQLNSYIVLLKDDVNFDTHKDWMQSLTRQRIASTLSSNPVTINYEYGNLNGYSATLGNDLVAQISGHPDVEGVFPDTKVKIQVLPATGKEMNDEEAFARAHGVQDTPMGTTWGLQRISQVDTLPPRSKDLALNYIYEEEPSLKKTKVDCYIVDTGVMLNHTDFEGRATWGATFPAGGPQVDDNGHGTHVAATVAGKRWGVAKTANIIAVKVLDAGGSGSTSDIVAGINWCINRHSQTQSPSVINMSLGGSNNRALNAIASRAVRSGIHVCVAAGNDGDDVADSSPASADGVITVGATHIRDERSNFSNWGQAVKAFAPGSRIISAGITSPTAFVAHDGTSMATPHVAGVVAHRLRNDPDTSPAQMLEQIQSTALSGVLNNIYQPGTPNLMLQV
ncbi:subtilisin-like protease 8 [Ceratobasidium sp. AG-Ba]|nr:subtilisin-like protease 8 [Ceratobasidium sp. AG-Ba]QRW08648.1 subtilisin-like protease 8 [Ceratobasidium sp. AG-Ba]